MRIKTEFWENEDPEIWRNKVLKIIIFFGLIFVTNTAINIFNSSWFEAILNGMMVLIVFLMWNSNTKYESERYFKEKELNNSREKK